MRVLILDNDDSFVYNLYQAIGELRAHPVVVRNDAITVDAVASIAPDAIVLSPDPGHPANPRDFGVCGEILRELGPTTPTLRVCLGHQGIAAALGGTIRHAARILHGKTSFIRHDDRTIFENLPNPMVGGRYHSLAIDRDSLPEELEVSATANDGEIMAVRHRRDPSKGSNSIRSRSSPRTALPCCGTSSTAQDGKPR